MDPTTPKMSLIHGEDDPAERCQSCFWRNGDRCHLNPEPVDVTIGHFCSHHATLDDRDRIVATFGVVS
jgi:hypothetical protein